MAQKFEKYDVKTTVLLNIREKGSMDAKIVGTMPKGTTVTIEGHSADGTFGRVATKKFIKLEFCERV